MINVKKYSDKYVLRFWLTEFFMYQSWSIYKLWNYYKNFKLDNPLEKILSKISSFYQILNKITEPDKNWILKSLCDKNNLVEWEWDDYEEDYYGINNILDDDFNVNIEKVIYGYSLSSYMHPWLKKEDEYFEWYLLYQEFYLLMQIYFWLYEEEEYKKELEKKDADGYYDDIKNYMNSWEEWVRDKQKDEDKKWFFQKKRKYSYKDYEKEFIPLGEVQEYSKLCLMRQDISWAFDWLEIEKIFDKSWCRERQKKQIDMINKEFWEEVIIEE